MIWILPSIPEVISVLFINVIIIEFLSSSHCKWLYSRCLWCLLLLYILAYLELVNGVIWFLIGQLSKTWRILNHLPEQKLVLLSLKLEFTVRIRQRHVLLGSGVAGTSQRPPQPTYSSSSHQGDLPVTVHMAPEAKGSCCWWWHTLQQRL